MDQFKLPERLVIKDAPQISLMGPALLRISRKQVQTWAQDKRKTSFRLELDN